MDVLQILLQEEMEDYNELMKRLEVPHGHAHQEQVY